MSETAIPPTISGVHPEDENKPGVRIEVIHGEELVKVVELANAQLAKGWRTWVANDHIVSKGRKWISGNEREDVTYFSVTLFFSRPEPTREWNGDNFAAVVNAGLVDIIPDDRERQTRSQNIVLAILEKFFSGKR